MYLAIYIDSTVSHYAICFKETIRVNVTWGWGIGLVKFAARVSSLALVGHNIV